MKILVAGSFKYYYYEQVVVDTLKEQNHHVETFYFSLYIKGFLGKIEDYFAFIGLLSILMNISLYFKVRRIKPEVLLIWRGTLISPILLKFLRRIPDLKLVSYNNDDPFSPLYDEGKINQRRLWRNFKKGIPYFDINLVYRPHNIDDYNKAGSRKTFLFPPYFIPGQIDSLLKKQFEKIYDVTFIGHCSKDRLEMVNYLLENGVNVKVYGTGWGNQSLSENYKHDRDISPLYGEEYFIAIIKSKMCLAFLSKLNRDVYTRRNFEIPACGTCMVSERTKELESLYIPNKEALFFSNPKELLYKIKNERSLDIGMHGKLRAQREGFDVNKRVLELINNIRLSCK